MKPSDLAPPLSQFQGVEANKGGLKRLVTELNSALTPSVPIGDLEDSFEAFWPKLEQVLIHSQHRDSKVPTRSTEDKIEEILTLVRQQVRKNSFPRRERRLGENDGPPNSLSDADLLFHLLTDEGMELGLTLHSSSVKYSPDTESWSLGFEFDRNVSGEISLPNHMPLERVRPVLAHYLQSRVPLE